MYFWLAKHSEPVARKQHVCVGCNEAIPIGTKHVYQEGVGDSHWQHNRWHNACFEYAVENGFD